MNTNPSPWSVQSGGGRLGSLLTVLDANGLPVASMRRQYLKTGYVTPAPDDARRLGNARLIASAPDLLTALEAFIAWDDEHHNNNDGGPWDKLDPIYMQAKAAVAKSRGES